MKTFIIKSNVFLKKSIVAFYHTEYIGYKKPGNPDYINVLKNTYNSFDELTLKNAVDKLKKVLEEILLILNFIDTPTTICVVPRAKTEYKPNQLLFKKTIKDFIENHLEKHKLIDGTEFIVRKENTRTTHLGPNTPNYNNDGDMPYPGITKKTCEISDEINNSNILLIDDIYTEDVNIDEDVIQALFDKGAKSVYFYSIGKTDNSYKNNNKLHELLNNLYLIKEDLILLEKQKQELQNEIFQLYGNFKSEYTQGLKFEKGVSKSYTFNNITEKELIEKAKKICPEIIEEKISKGKVAKSALKNYINEKETYYIKVIKK